MKITDTLKSYGKRWFGAPIEGIASFVDNLGVHADPSQREALKEYLGITYRCVNTIAEEVAQIENRLYLPLQENKKKYVTKHELLTILENPNPELSKIDFWEAHQAFMEMVGEVFWYFAKGEKTGKIKEVYLLRPDRMKVLIDKKGDVVGYKLMKNAGQFTLLTVDEVYHWKTFNPNNAYRGLGTLQAGLTYIATERFASRFTMNFLKNNATPAGVITIDQGIGKDAFKKFARQWREKLSGTENAGKIAIVRGAQVDFTKVGLSLADIDLKALRELTDSDIMKMFKVPKPLIGMADAQGLGRGNVETLEYIFMKRTIEPKMKRIDAGLQQILKKYYGKDSLYVDHKNVVPDDKEFNLTRLEKGVDKWITRDEARLEDGLEGIGADKLYTAINQVPVETSGSAKTKSNKKFTIKVSGKEKPVEKSLPEWDVTEKGDDTPQEIFRKTVQNIASSYEKKVRSATIQFLQDQQAKVLMTINPKKKLTAKAVQDGIDEAEEIALLATALYPIIRELTERAGEEAFSLVVDTSGDMSFSITPDIEKLLKEHIERMSLNFNRETIDKLAKTLTEGMQAGESNVKLAKRVKDVYSEATDYRALRVARSEAHWTAMNATEQAYFQSGTVKYKKWYANPGACQYCRSMDGTEVPVGESFVPQGIQVDGEEGGKFSTEYETIQNAHLHPNCECGLLPLEDMSKGYELKAIEKNIEGKVMARVSGMEKKVEGLDDVIDDKINGKMEEVNELTGRLNEVLGDEE